jgi:hypothetical protein
MSRPAPSTGFVGPEDEAGRPALQKASPPWMRAVGWCGPENSEPRLRDLGTGHLAAPHRATASQVRQPGPHACLQSGPEIAGRPSRLRHRWLSPRNPGTCQICRSDSR